MPTIYDVLANSLFTVLLGKNGAGKSTHLRNAEAEILMGQHGWQGPATARYITPERGGVLKYDPQVDLMISQDESWIRNTRRQNRLENFRQQSSVQFRNLELAVLREIEKDAIKRQDAAYTFDSFMQKINKYLPAIELVRSDKGFSIQNKAGSKIKEEEISSGESEFIALAIEILFFTRSDSENKVLLLDEPDVHLHPDLQIKLINLIEAECTERSIRVVIATHSTAIIGGFSDSADLQIVPITSRSQTDFKAFRRDEMVRSLIPIFGPHPLSSLFSQAPILLVEGEDDQRVIEQLVRSSTGRIKLKPCVVGTVTEMESWENWLNDFLPTLLDDPKAKSLRDLDSAASNQINDLGCVSRARLNCYAMENLLLCNEVIAKCGATPETTKASLNAWLTANANHQYASDVTWLVENFDARRTAKIKNVRNIVVAALDSAKPWEVIVGQALATEDHTNAQDSNSLANYLGEKAISLIFG